ncbi:Uncharacterised protein [Mycobacteroides abscessus subsp. bolletii]|nr:Uncharacterised protein [Mycobacteroides abscessus subsp. bolletii]
MFVTGRPRGYLRSWLNFPAGDQTFAGAAVLTYRGQVLEEVADDRGITDSTPGQVRHRVCQHWYDAPLIAAVAVGDDLRADLWGKLLESCPVGS